MPTLIGVWFALAGLLAAIAGLTDRRRVRRLRAGGATAWAMVVPRPASAHDDLGPVRLRNLVQFSLPDGSVVERLCPEPGKARTLKPGERVLVWYDPADPGDVVVYGRQGRHADWAFIAAGLFLIAIGVALAGFAR